METMASERDRWHSKMQTNRVYSALVRAQWSHLQRLSTPTLFWVSFINDIFPLKHLRSLPSPGSPTSHGCNQQARLQKGKQWLIRSSCLKQDNGRESKQLLLYLRALILLLSQYDILVFVVNIFVYTHAATAAAKSLSCVQLCATP